MSILIEKEKNIGKLTAYNQQVKTNKRICRIIINSNNQISN